MTTNLTNQNELIPSRNILRKITVGLQVIAMLAYYLPTIFTGGHISMLWLMLGFIQTLMFSAVFFRDSKKRVGLSIAVMVIATLLNIILMLVIAFFALIASELGLNINVALLYVMFSTLAVIFALCFPRKYKTDNIENTVDQYVYAPPTIKTL